MKPGLAIKAMTVTMLGAAPTVHAHAFGTHAGGFAAGFAHPFFGLDHLAAMVAVGWWAAQRRAVWAWCVPLAFVATMAAGAALAFAGVALPAVEAGIAASLLVLGLLLAAAVRLPTPIGVVLVAAFAVFHGQAHAVELPPAASPALYAAGFVLATAVLHAAGWFAGRVLGAKLAWATRAAGLALMAGGTWMLAA